VPVDGLSVGIERLQRAGAPQHAVEVFRRSYERLCTGDLGLLRESDIEPPGAVPELDPDVGSRESLSGVAVVRLNGGLGTTMATSARKGFLPVKDGRSFVDLAVGQAAGLRRSSSTAVPLLLMQSPATPASTSVSTAAAANGTPTVFVQSELPRLGVDDLVPVCWPRDPRLEWAPAGHGDVYPALACSGLLGELLDAGFDLACISSIDNVAAVVDGRVAAAMRRDGIPFLMEVTDRTEVDRKGGHLARRRGGGLVLRDLAQAPVEERAAFYDHTRYGYFNTNTIWVDLRALASRLAGSGGVLDLPLIANRKPIDPYEPDAPEVLQIESAMGAAISAFEDAVAIRVDRRGFNPVKTTAELLAVRSDAYVLTEECRLELAPEREGVPPVVELDPVHFARQRDFDRRFPGGPPSLLGCERLVVRGDVVFEAEVVVRGHAHVEHDGPGHRVVARGSVLGDG
jgi:UTP--glucose-1-phosphate uridylyltransferase